MRRIGHWVGFLGLSLGLGIAVAQEQPLINYADGFGSFDYDYYRGDNNQGMVRDGIAEGFSVRIPLDFTPSLDEEDKVQGRAAQKLSFDRNASDSVSARFTKSIYFPTADDYPQPGETVRIRLWYKAANWVNARFRVFVRGLDGNNAQTLVDLSNPPTSWTQLDVNYVVPASNPAGIAVELRVDARAGVSRGEIWFDDLVVTGSKRWRPHAPRVVKIIAPYNPAYSEIQNDWVYYAREFDAFVAKWEAIKQLRTHRPDLRNVIYYNAIYSYRTNSPDSWTEQDLYGYWYCNTRHPDWFLLNILGNRQTFYPYLFLMDIGNPETSAWAAHNLDLSMTYADGSSDVVMLDSFIDFFFTNFRLQKYPTPASRIAAMHKHMLNIRRVLDRYNVRAIVNAAGSPYSRDQVHTYFLRMGLIDGFVLEQAFTNIYDLPGYVPFYVWERQVDTLSTFSDRVRTVYSAYTISNPVEGRRQKMYALASYLLCVGGEMYFYLDKHPLEGEPRRLRAWRPDEDFDVPLGNPTGRYQVFFRSSDYQGGLYYRPFENGFVLVNPTGNIAPRYKDGAVFSYILDADYWELGSRQVYPAGTRIKLYPKEGKIFVRASSALRGGASGRGGIKPLPHSEDELKDLGGYPVPRR